VAVRDGDTWSRLTVNEGLAGNHVNCIAEGQDGRMWFGTNGHGLSCWDGHSFTTWSERDGLPHDVIYALCVDNDGILFGSTVRGLFRLNPQTRELLVFDRSDGLAHDECNCGAGFRDRTGRLWFGTIGGVSCLVPKDLPANGQPCQAHLTRFTVGGVPVGLGAQAQVAPRGYDYVFDYTAIEFLSPHKVVYRARLDGLESDWLPHSMQRQWRYTNLAPGEYVFMVQARNWSCQWSETASVRFVVPS